MICGFIWERARVGFKGIFVIKKSLLPICDLKYIIYCNKRMGIVTRGLEVLNYTCIMKAYEAHMGLMT